jgi:hypothetical protein
MEIIIDIVKYVSMRIRNNRNTNIPSFSKIVGDMIIRKHPLLTYKIWWDNVDSDEFRILLRAKQFTRDSKYNLFNGVILSVNVDGSVHILNIPSRGSMIINKYETDINEYFYCYPLLNGVSMNLYYYDNKWRISTANGINMNDMEIPWSIYTYEQLFTNAVGDDYSQELDINYCYNFIVSSMYDESCHFIQKVNLNTYEVIYINPPSFAQQYKTIYINPRAQANAMNIANTINNKCKHAYAEFKNNYKIKNYGYLFVSENEDNIYQLRSTFYDWIDNNIYKKIAV